MFLLAKIDNVLLGTQQISKIFVGDILTWQKEEPDTIAPVTNVYPNAGTYDAPVQVWFEVYEASTTYYTTDGTTPTENSNIFREPLTISDTTTLKYFSVDKAGNKEAVKTSVFTINAVDLSTWRYIRYQGYGDQTGATTRLIELEALNDVGANVLAGKLPISGEPVSTGAPISAVTDGVKAETSGTYSIWWVGAGVPNLIYDLGADLPVKQLNVVMYSPSFDPRQTRFKLFVSKDNANWYSVIDMSANTTPQPPEGWGYAVAFA